MVEQITQRTIQTIKLYINYLWFSKGSKIKGHTDQIINIKKKYINIYKYLITIPNNIQNDFIVNEKKINAFSNENFTHNLGFNT